jgi:hypothetical protein
MGKLMKGFKRMRRDARRVGDEFNSRPSNVVLNRRRRNGLVWDKRRRMWVKKGSR